jgi:hypothetical protein
MPSQERKHIHEIAAIAQPPWTRGKPVQPGGREGRQDLQEGLRRSHLPSRLGQDHRRSGSPLLGGGIRRKGERQDGPADPDGRILKKYNQQHPASQVLILEYDDFNPFLDQFSQQEPNLARWELRDHMDAILSLGVRRLIDFVLTDPPEVTRQSLARLDPLQKRDLLMLAAMYDRSYDTTLARRWFRLRRVLRYGWPLGGLYARKEFLAGLLATGLLVGTVTYLGGR